MEDKDKKEKNFTRRDFLKVSGGLTGMVLFASPIFTLFRKFRIIPKQKAADKSLSQWCMVIDLRKCQGLRKCTQACIDVHFVPKGQEWIQVFKVDLPGGGSYYFPMPCYHCENAACVKVCPVKATYHTEEGLVLVDAYRCIGCRQCMAACPYQRRFFNWGTPKLPAEAALVKYSPEFPVPAQKGTVSKCIFCAHFLKEGQLPACVRGCPNGTLYMGDYNRDMATNGQEVVKLSKFLDDNKAYRFREELGTQPRVWYLPGAGEQVGRSPQDMDELRSIVWPESGE